MLSSIDVGSACDLGCRSVRFESLDGHLSGFGPIGALKSRFAKFKSMSSRDLNDAFKEISHTTRKLTHLGLTPIQTEVLREIVDGNRTLSELTLAIFHSRYTDEKFQTYRSRIKRAVKTLERRGFVSKKSILGRDKPYGLTQHGIAKITAIAPGMPDPAVFEVYDVVVFPATVFLAMVACLTLEPAITNLFSVFLGISIVRAARLVRRVI